MFAHAFRFDPSRLHAAFAPRKPRHPLARLAMGLFGLGVLVLLVFFSVFVGAAMLAVGLMYRLVSQRGDSLLGRSGQAASPSQLVVDGEYRVVGKTFRP